MEEIAYAKINLALHVRARKPDGYHRIETLFAFAEDGDRLCVAPGAALTLEAIGPFAAQLGPADDNLVLRAAEALRSRFEIADGAALLLEKNLPVASGIGGGSADAAAALRLLSRWWRIDADDDALSAIAGELGADVPACLASRTARGEGRGDVLTPFSGDALSGTPLLLANPGIPIATSAVFKGWDGVDRGPLPQRSLVAERNDLQPPAIEIAPVICEVLDALERVEGATLARMSGSGATCFALFDSDVQRDAANASIAAAWPAWWTLASRLR